MDEGRLDIDLTWTKAAPVCKGAALRVDTQEAEIIGCDIRSSRPFHLMNYFTQKSCRETLSLLPMLYYICGRAQWTAGLHAFKDAADVRPCSYQDTASALCVDSESLREYALQILKNWGGLRGVESKPSEAPISFIQASQSIHKSLYKSPSSADEPLVVFHAKSQLVQVEKAVQELQSLVEVHILGETHDWFLQLNSLSELKDWARTTSTIAAKVIHHFFVVGEEALGAIALPKDAGVDEDMIRHELTSSKGQGFVKTPHMDGSAIENSSYTLVREQPLVKRLERAFGCGVLTRYVARLVGVAQLVKRLQDNAQRLPTLPMPTHSDLLRESEQVNQAEGWGFGRVETGRGLLFHGALLERGAIARYLILAPTEWNFAKGGSASKALKTMQGTDEFHLHSQAMEIAASIDPCVKVEVYLNHA